MKRQTNYIFETMAPAEHRFAGQDRMLANAARCSSEVNRPGALIVMHRIWLKRQARMVEAPMAASRTVARIACWLVESRSSPVQTCRPRPSAREAPHPLLGRATASGYHRQGSSPWLPSRQSTTQRWSELQLLICCAQTKGLDGSPWLLNPPSLASFFRFLPGCWLGCWLVL